MGINVQICWEKFANYWDVEMRLVPMEGDRFTLSAEEAVKRCDENTIGVIAILGSTFDGSYEPIQEICDALDALQAETGIDVPVHVDGASGRSSRRSSIPISCGTSACRGWRRSTPRGTEYELVYPGVGWIVWRDSAALPDGLIFWVNYLGDNMPTFALNFSRPGAVVAQYYNFLRLGFDGYRRVQEYARDVATRLSGEIEQLGPFEAAHARRRTPVFAFTVKDEIENFTVFDVSNAMRERGWQVPAYTFPKNREDLAALRVVVRRGFTHDMGDMLLADLKRQLPRSRDRPRRCTTTRRQRGSATSGARGDASGSSVMASTRAMYGEQPAWEVVRPGSTRFRLLVSWVLGRALLAAAWIVPARTSGTSSALVAAAVIAALNAILPPVVAAVRLPFVAALGFLVLLVVDALMLLAADAITDGDLTVDSFWSALGVAAAAAIGGDPRDRVRTNDDDTYTFRVIQRIARRSRARGDGRSGDRLPRDRRPSAAGPAARDPERQRADDGPLARGGSPPGGWETDLSSQTGASQAGILLGSNDDIPAFRWVEKETATLMVCSAPADCEEIERRHRCGRGLLTNGGASRGTSSRARPTT
jgi:uncharacterized membrane protein YvlD (DUF360 family)